MSEASLFRDFRQNLSIKNSDDISTKYCNITARLNLDFWDTDSDTVHSLQIGSYGRRTAIDGVSDLDMVFELPIENFDRYKKLQGNGPSAMLQEVRESLLKRYPKSDVRADGQVVGIFFSTYHVEVLPAFLDENGDYIHGDTNNGGSWKTTKPRPEIEAVRVLDNDTNGNLKDVCRMLRAWRNHVGAGIGGLLIDTFAYNFFVERDYKEATYNDYPKLFVSLFDYLADLPEQDYWMAPGSGQRVKCNTKFQTKARRAAIRCQEAIDQDDENNKAKIWRKVFGKNFPEVEITEKAAGTSQYDNEEFIENRFPVDIRYNISLECDIREGLTIRDLLQHKLRRRERVPIGRSLRFHITFCDVPGNYAVWWKVRNQGHEAERRHQLRGEITHDKGRMEITERSDFQGDHYVEAYAVKDGVCVAREHIKVPI